MTRRKNLRSHHGSPDSQSSVPASEQTEQQSASGARKKKDKASKEGDISSMQKSLAEFLSTPAEKNRRDKGDDSEGLGTTDEVFPHGAETPSSAGAGDQSQSPTQDELERRCSETGGGITHEDLMLKLCANGKVISRLSQVIDELRGELHTLQVDNDRLKKEVRGLKEREEDLQEELREVRQRAEVADRNNEQLAAYVRRNNLRIYGIPESEGNRAEPETQEQCEKKVLSLLRSKLKLDIRLEDMEVAHRLGRRQPDRQTPRGIIVRFLSRRAREAVIRARRNLRGTRTVIVEDLTPRAYTLLCRVKDDREVCREAWSRNGAVFMKTVSGRIVRVADLAELADPQKRAAWSGTSHQDRRAFRPSRSGAASRDSSPDDRRRRRPASPSSEGEDSFTHM